MSKKYLISALVVITLVLAKFTSCSELEGVILPYIQENLNDSTNTVCIDTFIIKDTVFIEKTTTDTFVKVIHDTTTIVEFVDTCLTDTIQTDLSPTLKFL